MTTPETAKNILRKGGGRIIPVRAAAGLLGAAMLAASSAFGLDAVEVRDVHAVTDYADTSGMEKQLDVYDGGKIDFQAGNSGGYVRDVICIKTANDVEFSASAGVPRPVQFAGDVFNPGGGQLVLSESARFGTYKHNASITEGRDMVVGLAKYRDPGGTGYPYLAPNAIRFVNPGDSLTLTGRVALTAWPTCNYTIETHSTPALHGDNMISEENYVQGGVFTVPWDYFFWANPQCMPGDVKVVIPKGVQVVAMRTKLNASTGELTYPGAADNTYSNDIEVAGELLVKQYYQSDYCGDITGPSSGKINVQASRYIRRFSGDLKDFKGTFNFKTYGGNSDSYFDNRRSRCYFGKSAPENGIRMYVTSNMTTECAFFPHKNQAGDWTISKVKADGVYETEEFGLRGACWYMCSRQNLTIGTLQGGSGSGGIAIAAGYGVKNSCTLTVGSIADGFELVITNGVPVTIGSMGSGVKIRYYGEQCNTNAVNLADGCVLGELEVPANDTVYLNGGAVEKVTGTGTLVVTGGDVRLGAVAATVNVKVQGGTVEFGNGEDVAEILGSSRVGIWLDASDTAKMVGAYNEGWAKTTKGKKVLAAHPAVTLNGSLAATYTNGFPLIEKWYDKRPEQTKLYGWNDRSAGYSQTLYTLSYPYLVPNGLNGRPYMSFGEHGMTDLDETFGTSRYVGKENEHRERRRMPLMYDNILDSKGEIKPQGYIVRPRAIIVVFGSQQGGGRAIVGSYNGNDRWEGSDIGEEDGNVSSGAYYLRGGDSNSYDVANSLFKKGNGNSKTAWIDGKEIDPYTTGLNGGWQIISVSNGANDYKNNFRSLGEGEKSKEAEHSGGQNYAELIAFTNTITAAERQAVENYLAVKWGLPNAQAAKCSVTVEAGGTVKGAIANVSGDGTWELKAPEAVTLNGTSFTGTIAGNGTVAVADAAQLPKLDEGFTGGVAVTGDSLEFTYADGKFTPALTMPERDMEFPSAMTVKVNGTLAAGEYELVSGRTLTGLYAERCTLEIGRTARLVRTDDALILRVIPGTQVIFR